MGAVRPYASWGRFGPMLHGGGPALCFMGVARPYAPWGRSCPMLHGGGPALCSMGAIHAHAHAPCWCWNLHPRTPVNYCANYFFGARTTFF